MESCEGTVLANVLTKIHHRNRPYHYSIPLEYVTSIIYAAAAGSDTSNIWAPLVSALDTAISKGSSFLKALYARYIADIESAQASAVSVPRIFVRRLGLGNEEQEGVQHSSLVAAATELVVALCCRLQFPTPEGKKIS